MRGGAEGQKPWFSVPGSPFCNLPQTGFPSHISVIRGQRQRAAQPKGQLWSGGGVEHVLVLIVLWLTGSSYTPKLQLPLRAVPQAPLVLLSLNPWPIFQAGEEPTPDSSNPALGVFMGP